LAGAVFVAGVAVGFFDRSCAPALSGIAAASNIAPITAKYPARFVIMILHRPPSGRPSIE
jgi:hypothetical protein